MTPTGASHNILPNCRRQPPSPPLGWHIHEMLSCPSYNVRVSLELQKSEPDLNKISAWMRRYFYVVATQGVMQVAMIIIMTRFRAGV
jgi:hypothetical protein